MTTHHLTEGAAPLTVKVGDTVEFSQPQNATTGYSWHFDDASGHLEKLVDEVRGIPAGKVGAGGTRFVQVSLLLSQVHSLSRSQWKVSKPGQFDVKFDNIRPWEAKDLKKTVSVTAE